MRFGISATSLMCPKNLRTRLRPVNVCRALDEILGFLEAKARDGTDFLDDFNLLLARGQEDDRELGLFFNRSSGGSGRTSHRDGGGGGHAPLFFKQLCELGSFQHGEAREVVYNLL